MPPNGTYIYDTGIVKGTESTFKLCYSIDAIRSGIIILVIIELMGFIYEKMNLSHFPINVN